jgi:predicted molibdopterin-dependent oxidoreductase YjgC
VRAEALGAVLESGRVIDQKYLGLNLDSARLSSPSTLAPAQADVMLVERVAEIGLYAADPLVRRATSLQQTADAKRFAAEMHPETLSAMGLTNGAWVDLNAVSASASARVQLQASDRVGLGVVRLPQTMLANHGLPLSGALRVAGRA